MGAGFFVVYLLAPILRTLLRDAERIPDLLPCVTHAAEVGGLGAWGVPFLPGCCEGSYTL